MIYDIISENISCEVTNFESTLKMNPTISSKIIHKFEEKILKNIYNISHLTRWQIFLLYTLLTVLLRFFSFFPSVIDHDESTYLEIARMLLSGNVLYIDMVDIKPPGIFIILAGFQAVFGHSIFVMRLLVAIWIGITSFLIYSTGKLLLKDERASFAAGIIYILFISTWSYYGISITPEIFFNLFTIAALYVLLRKQSPACYFLAGLLAGMGFLVKYLVIADFAVIMLFVTILSIYSERKNNVSWIIFSIFLSGAGFFLPFIMLNLTYYLNGNFGEFYNIIYLAPSRYALEFEPWIMLKYILSFQLLFIPFFFFFYYALIIKQKMGKAYTLVKQFLILWSLIALVAVTIAGKSFGHYTIQLMLPVSLIASLFFHSDRRLPAPLNRMFSWGFGRYILLVLVIVLMMIKIEYLLRRDIPREIATYLQPRLTENDVVYSGNYHHILYYLLKKESPTKYVHRSLLLSEHHIKALDIKVDEEFRKIIAHKPVYIVIEKDIPNEMIQDLLNNHYTLEKDFGENIFLFRRMID